MTETEHLRLGDPGQAWELAGVGIGPGDPGLISLRAAATLEEADLVIAPSARQKSESLARKIMEEAGIKPRQILELEFPMCRDPASLYAAWEASAKPALTALEAGQRVAFITLGDPSLYSTWQYFKRTVLGHRPETRSLTIPGIMAFGAAAAAMQLSLAEQNETLALLPLPSPVSKLADYLPLFDRLVVYKIGARLQELNQWLTSQGMEGRSWLACAVGQAGRERLGLLPSLVANGAEGYLSLAIIETSLTDGL